MRRRQRLASLAVALAALPAAALANGEPPVEGFLQPYRRITLSAPEIGRIASIDVKQGDAVQKDQVVATLDTRVFQAALSVAEARAGSQGRLESAAAVRDRARRRLDSLNSLSVKGHAHAEEVAQARADLAVAEANVQAVTEEREIARRERAQVGQQIEHRRVRSPIAGVVSIIHKDVAETVRPDTDPIMTLVEIARLKMDLFVPTARALGYKAGDAALLDCPVLARQGKGQLEFVSPVIEAESDTIRVRVAVENAVQQGLRAGARCAVRVEPGRPAARAAENAKGIR